MTKTTTPPTEFEEAFITGLKTIFEEKIVFNQVLGLKITSVLPERVTARIDMKPELVGHYSYNRIHGGVISAGLDAMGGLACMAAIGARHMDEAPEQRLHRFAKLGTIDLRIDYLRPGSGAWFLARGFPLRTGNKVAVTRMELFNDQQALIAVGTAAYTVS
jgi:uncharacterized protein (TIGR00369 family)